MAFLERYIWQDREIRFDVSASSLALRNGEFVVDTQINIEDTKGNSGESGTLIATNLRLMWISGRYARTNLTIGYNCVVSVNIRTTTSRLRGQSQALFVLTKFNNTRFEFIFTSVTQSNGKTFQIIENLHRAYDKTRLYRDIKLRGAVIRDKQLLLLPQESIYHKINGVWNLSSDQGNLGIFFFTNVRLVWHANLAENFNVSIPHLQIRAIKVRESKFGKALVIETMPQAGGYVLGFKIDPPDQLHEIAKQLQNIYSIFSKDPIFGVNVTPEDKALQFKFAKKDTEVEIVETEDTDAFAIYYADVNKNVDRDVVFSNELGLAIEQLKEGVTIQSLWSVN